MATLVTGRMVEDQSITLNDLTQSSGALMFRNKIINGNFDIWQRGTSFSGIASEAYHADRWNVAYNGSGGTRIITRENFDLGQTLVPNEPTYFLRWNQSVAGTGATFNFLRQKIESVRTFANKQITVSFYAKAASPIAIAVYGLQWYGSGGSPSSGTFTNYSTGLNVTTSWQKFTVNLTVPSIAGKTLGTNNDDRLEITFGLPLNTTFTFDIAQVQVEEGSVATPFEQRPIGMELSLCQRYYQKHKSPQMKGISTATVNVHRIGMMLPVRMRKTPVTAMGALPVYNGGTPRVISSIYADYSNSEKVEYDLVTDANMGGIAGGAATTYDGGDVYLQLDAEL